MLDLLNRIPPDKARHYVAGSLLAAVGALHSIAIGVLLCVVFAIAKEARDRITRRGNPEFWDVVATLAGGLAVLLPLAVWRIGGAL
jgi:hypothetical protein